jgi:hypothetical protein
VRTGACSANDQFILFGFRLRSLGRRCKPETVVKLCVVAGDECPIPVRLWVWRDEKGHVGFPTK